MQDNKEHLDAEAKKQFQRMHLLKGTALKFRPL
jgi:hypothetical protein